MRFDTTSEITFRKLSIFMTFMEKGNIARTAETLGLSGVSVHRALHTLEENVRCPLFTHKGRNLIALPSAWTLLEYCQEVMQVMERGLEESRKIAGIGQGRLRVGTLYSLTLETVPRLIMGMKLRRPDLEMDLTMGSNETLLHMLDEGSLDAILISISESDIDRNSALAEGFATYAGFQEAFHIAGFEPEIVTRVNDIFSMLSLVQAGVGFTLMPGRMKKVYENSVQLLKLAEPYQMQQLIAIVFARNREQDPSLRALAAEGRMYARSLQDGA